MGIKNGCSVGECDGLWLGISMIGCAVGRRVVGASCGCPVGSIVGVSVGSADGDKEGCSVGLSLDLKEGDSVGR